MLKKAQRTLERQWMLGRLNLVAAARRMGYKKGSLSKGVSKVRTVLGDMGITVL